MVYAKAIYKWLIPVLFAIVLCIYMITPHTKWDIDYTHNVTFIHWFYYFAFMLVGAFLREKHTDARFSRLVGSSLMLSAFLSFLFAYFLKFFVRIYPAFLDVQILFPVILLITILLLYESSKRFIQIERKGVGFSSLTLEIYLVQFLCIEFALKFSFPLRLVVCVVMICVSAFCLKKLSAYICLPLSKFEDYINAKIP